MAKSSRTMLQRAKAIFRLIRQRTSDFQDSSLTKSTFQEVGISPHNMDQWLELISFIQQMPRVQVNQSGRKTVIDTMDNEFMLYLRKQFYDPSLNFEERSSAMMMYLKVMINMEKSKGEEIDWKELINDPWEISRPTIIRLAEEGEEMMRSANV